MHDASNIAQPKRILIAEDEPALREAFVFLLATQGYEIETADNGRSAIDALKSFTPDLILLDMVMPIMGGVEFLQKSRVNKKFPNTKVVVFSNLSDSLSIGDVKKYGVVKTILKASLTPTELLEIVKLYTS